MSEDTKQNLSYWIDILWKVSTPVLFVAAFYLKATFATSSDVRAMHDALAERMTKSETAILLLSKDNEVNARQDKALDDHETRIRTLERSR